jgi:hypothetical protein
MFSAQVRRFQRWFLLPTVAVMMLSVLGCGSSGTATGKVTYQGKAVVFGTVQFESGGVLKQGNITKEGTYTIAGLPVGPAKAAVNSPDPSGTTRKRPEKVGQAPAAPAESAGWFAIPDDYQDISQPKLNFEIKSGRNTIDIDLK